MKPDKHVGLLGLPDLQLRITQEKADSLLFQGQISSPHILVILPGLGPVDGKQVSEKHSRMLLETCQGAFTFPCPLQAFSHP